MPLDQDEITGLWLRYDNQFIPQKFHIVSSQFHRGRARKKQLEVLTNQASQDRSYLHNLNVVIILHELLNVEVSLFVNCLFKFSQT